MSLRGFLRFFTHIQLLPVLENGEETTLIGGQAVMEGVMMRTPHNYCVAVRRANGEIVTEESALPRISDRHRIFRLPVMRGLATLGSAMWLGMKALRFSANCAMEDLEGPKKDREKSGKKAGGSWAMTANLVFSLAFGVALYNFVPLYAAKLLGRAVPPLSGNFAMNVIDGIVRIAIFLAFIYLLSRLKDMHRMFQYHGGEHRVVFNFESGEPLNVQNAQRFVTWHPRCGTSFLMVVLIIALVVFAVLPVHGFWARFAWRIALLPVLVGVSYEIIRFAAKRRNALLAVMTKPGLWLQRVTTQPPSDAQTAVAIRALERAMEMERSHGGTLVIA
ncbi:MAG: DUF1385 domain-containing protein [Bryobacteraceae bacterium]